MQIRSANSDDFTALCSIDSMAMNDPSRRDAIATWLHAGTCQLAEMDGHVTAYGVLTHHFFGSPFIEMLMVGSQFRRLGLGTTLIRHFRALCPGSKLFSSTNMSNVPMQVLLIKASFKPSGYIDNLDENDPEIVFYSPPLNSVGGVPQWSSDT